MKKKKASAFLLAVVLVAFVFAALPADASILDDIAFMVVNDNIMELKTNTMPFIQSGKYYVPYTIFSDLSLGVYPFYDTSNYRLTLLNKRASLTFDSPKGVAYDREKQYNEKLVGRNGTVYVPIEFVCEYFGLEFQYASVQPAPIYRIILPGGSSLSTFRGNARDMLSAVYAKYITGIYIDSETSSPPGASPGTQVTPSAAPATPTPSAPPPPKMVYITFDSMPSQDTELILDILDAASAKATFFLLGSAVRENPGATRRIIGSGHQVGLCGYTGSDAMLESPAALTDELLRTNELLNVISGKKTRLFRFIQGSDDKTVTAEMRDALIFAGYRYWDWTVRAGGLPGEPVSTAVNRIITALNGSGSSVVISFGTGEDTPEILAKVLEYINSNDYIIRLIYASEMPINRHGDVRTELLRPQQ